MPAEALKKYAGEYDSDLTDDTFKISLDGDALFLHWPGSPPWKLDPITESRFAVPAVNSELIFERDENGVVSKLTVRLSGGREMTCTRRPK